MQTVKKYVPGIAASFVIALAAKWVADILPTNLISASVIGLFAGMVINRFWHPTWLKAGLTFTSKKLLKLAIILLGLSLSIKTVLEVGKMSLCVMVFTLATCFGVGHFLGKALGLNWKTSNLISTGAGICGGSAIAALAPVIEADDMDVAYAMSTIFLFDMVLLLVFPPVGRLLGLSDMAFGMWAGTAVHDTSSVVAAGFAFSETAGDFAAMVKLTRTLAIIPIVVVFAVINTRMKQKEAGATGETAKVKFTKIFPWFILGFVAMAVLNSTGIVPKAVSTEVKSLSKFIMVMALTAIGLNTDLKKMIKSGLRPMVFGCLLSILVAAVALAVEYMMGLI